MARVYGLYSHIQKNRIKSVFLLASFVLLIHAVLFSLVLLFEAGTYGGTAQEILEAAIEDVRYAWPAGLIAAGLWFLIAYAFHQNSPQQRRRVYQLLLVACQHIGGGSLR